MNRDKSNALYEKAKNYIPGGVNSPVRAFGSVDKAPIFVDRADGAYIYDIDGNKYLDYISSWGPLIFGHNDPEMIETFKSSLEKGITYGVPSYIEVSIRSFILFIDLKKVDFPHPLVPTILTNSPGWIVRFTSASACVISLLSVFAKLFVTLSNSRTRPCPCFSSTDAILFHNSFLPAKHYSLDHIQYKGNCCENKTN